MPRLALCHLCHSITRLPDPPASAPLVPARWEWVDEDGKTQEYQFRDPDDGSPVMVAQYDPALEDWATRHEHQDIPDTVKKHDIWATDQLTWQTADVIAQVQQEMQGLTGEFYAERDELKDDAMTCFEKHNRPQDSCVDCFSEEKLIGGHESNRNMPKVDRLYLCHLCPFVHGFVIPKVRDAKGKRVGKPTRR